MRRETSPCQDALHGVHADQYREADGYHWMVNDRHKYIWLSQTGEEHLLDVVDDPNEDHYLTRDADIDPWRQRLAEDLADRPEEFG